MIENFTCIDCGEQLDKEAMFFHDSIDHKCKPVIHQRRFMDLVWEDECNEVKECSAAWFECREKERILDIVEKWWK